MKYYLALKNKGILIYATTWMDLEDFMLWEVSQTQEDKYCMIPYIYIYIYINPEYSLEGPMLNLKLQYFAYLMWRANALGNAGIDWGQEKKGETEDEMVGWHHRLNGHEFEWTPGDSEERRLVCCSPGGCKKLDMTEQLSNNNHLYVRHVE